MPSAEAHRTAVRQVERQGEQLTREDQFAWLARAGLVARGVVYGVIGLLAIKLALGDGGKATDQQGALHTIAGQPLGKVLLALVAIGLAGYALWRLVRAVLGHGAEASDSAKDRVSGVVAGIGYGGLCVTAVEIIFGAAGGGGPSSHPAKTTGGVLAWPGGTVLVALVGVVFVGVGLDQGYTAVKRKFLDDSKTAEMGPRVRSAFTALGVFGHLARMVVFAMIGYFLIKAAIAFDPHNAVSLDGALARLGQRSYGPVLLGIVAAGLIGFAGYSLLDARYCKV